MEAVGTDQRFPVRRIFCLGRSYRAHAFGRGDDPDVNPPFFFIKPRDALVDYREGHLYPQVTKALRYEGEMVTALKSWRSDINAADARDHVRGCGVSLDMTRQDLRQAAQRLSRPCAISKSVDKTAPVGPRDLPLQQPSSVETSQDSKRQRLRRRCSAPGRKK